jgi:predicted carbohydrate-binding protein with CBM5 and CBM33 domain
VWNIGDTPMAFYSCVDLNVGGGGGTVPSTPSNPSPPAEQPKPPAQEQPKPPAQEQPKPPAQEQPPPAQGTKPAAKGDWAANVAYKTGDKVNFKGKTYECRQGHTSLSSWEPSIYTLALWLPL